MSTSSDDRELGHDPGMTRKIDRRDFLNGVAIGVTAGLSALASAQAQSAAPKTILRFERDFVATTRRPSTSLTRFAKATRVRPLSPIKRSTKPIERCKSCCCCRA